MWPALNSAQNCCIGPGKTDPAPARLAALPWAHRVTQVDLSACACTMSASTVTAPYVAGMSYGLSHLGSCQGPWKQAWLELPQMPSSAYWAGIEKTEEYVHFDSSLKMIAHFLLKIWNKIVVFSISFLLFPMGMQAPWLSDPLQEWIQTSLGSRLSPKIDLITHSPTVYRAILFGIME